MYCTSTEAADNRPLPDPWHRYTAREPSCNKRNGLWGRQAQKWRQEPSERSASAGDRSADASDPKTDADNQSVVAEAAK